MLARIRTSVEEKDQGFTLIELLVVMIIIGILAAIAIPAFTNQRKKAYDTAAKSDVANVATEIQSWMVDNTLPAAASTTINSAGTAFTAAAPYVGIDTKVTSTSTIVAKIQGTGGTTPGAFTVCGYSSSGSTSATSAWVFDSSQGGMQSGKVTCP